jgi:prepilin-type N-terminal cleavage/methylation domain-containing protein
MKNEKLMYKLTRGFTLIELIVVISIIAILALILVPTYTNYIDTAQETVLTANTKNVENMIIYKSVDFDKSNWHGSWNADDKTTLNNYIEANWEMMDDGTYSNSLGIVNPISDNKSILDFDKTLGSGDGYCPAVFMTSKSKYSYDNFKTEKNLKGTIVAYFDTASGDESIQFFYVNKDGKKSEFNQIFK